MGIGWGPREMYVEKSLVEIHGVWVAHILLISRARSLKYFFALLRIAIYQLYVWL